MSNKPHSPEADTFVGICIAAMFVFTVGTVLVAGLAELLGVHR